MRILFFSTAFPQPYERSRNPDNLERCLALAQSHDVHVMAPYSWLHLASAREGDDASLARRLTISRPLFFYPPGVLRATHAWCMWQGVRRAAVHLVKEFRPDVVLSYWTFPDTAVAMRIAKLAGIGCVAIVGGSDVLAIASGVRAATARRVTRVLRQVDAIAAVSDSLKDHITALGIAPEKIVVLPAAVDTTVFFPGDREQARNQLGIPLDAPVMLWVGRMVAVKALEVLLDALHDLRREWPTLRLYLIGDGPLRRSLEMRVAAEGLSGHVVFRGRIAHRDLPPYYRASDLTALPSRWEGMPNALLESHACGTPFVATAVGAIPQLAEPDVDEVVPAGDCARLAAAVSRCWHRRSDRRSAAIKRARGWEQMADRLSDLLSSTHAAHAARRIQHPNAAAACASG